MIDIGSGASKNNKTASKRWLIAAIAAVLALDYATILRVEIFSEIQTGKTLLEAIMHGNPYLALIGISISVLGVGWIIYLLAGQGRGRSGG